MQEQIILILIKFEQKKNSFKHITNSVLFKNLIACIYNFNSQSFEKHLIKILYIIYK